MKKDSTTIGFVDLLTLIFITLKLIGNIDWNWFWVISPLVFQIITVSVIKTIAENRRENDPVRKAVNAFFKQK